MPPLFNGPDVLSFASDKFFAENFSMNSNLDDSGISLPVFLLELKERRQSGFVTVNGVETPEK